MPHATLPWTSPTDSILHQSAALTCDVTDPADTAVGKRIRLSEVVSALSCALDITEGQPEGHAARSCLIGMRLATMLGLSAADRSALYYALQLKDLGCSSNAARVSHLFGADDHEIKRSFKTTDWPKLGHALGYIKRNLAPDASLMTKLGRFMAIGVDGQKGAKKMVQIRCERGAAIAHLFGLPEATSRAIHDLDEHWNGAGHPEGIRGDAISPLARIAGISQTVEVFANEFGVDAAMNMARKRRGRWFDPKLVDLLLSLRHDDKFWSQVYGDRVLEFVKLVEPAELELVADDDRLDRIALGFAQVVDAKSAWTRRHSEKVTELAVGIGRVLGFDDGMSRWFRRASLLHDIGKLGVSNTILDKPGRLTDEELAAMRRHPLYTHRILSRVEGFGFLAEVAASHHERLDGKGYHRGLTAKFLSKPVRALVVADMFEAMTAERPYRDTMSVEKVLGILDKDRGSAICPEAFHALKFHLDTVGYEPSRWSQAG